MSKSSIIQQDSLAFYGSASSHQKQSFNRTTNSSSSIPINNNIKNSTVAPTASVQRQARNTHRHHRKPEANLNHLLNFSYARPSTDNNNTSLHSTRRPKTNPSFGRGSGHHPLDKSYFVNANYRFVVHPSGDFRANLLESDLPVPWEHILQVLVSGTTQRNACPICLDDVPVAPRMAQCGHTFCFPCILRYLESEDLKTGKFNKQWRKCPICHDGIYEKDLRPVRWVDTDGSLPQKGAEVVLQLMKREAGSMCALPSDGPWIATDVVPWFNQADVLEHARICRGDASYMDDQAQAEIAELQRSQRKDAAEFGDDGYWSNMAIDHVQEMNAIHQTIGSAPKPTSQARKLVREPITYSDTEASHAVIADGSYYFYQPKAGRHYYLSSLDIRILKKAFGSFANLPSVSLSKIEHTSTCTLDDALRKRTKYLAHLPLGCEITLLECDWAGILDKDIITSFKPEIEKRRKKRHDKAVSEESARRKAQAAEERRERAGIGELLWQDEDSSYFARNDESNTYEVFAEDVPSNLSLHSGSVSAESFEQRSVWGQPLVTSSAAPPTAEDDAWSEQLQKFYEESALDASVTSGLDGGAKKSKGKKKKLVLMSTNGGRRG